MIVVSQVTQEKSKLEAKNKINAAKVEEGRGKLVFSHFGLNIDLTGCNFSVPLEIEPYEKRNEFSYLVSFSAHCVQSLVPEGMLYRCWSGRVNKLFNEFQLGFWYWHILK